MWLDSAGCVFSVSSSFSPLLRCELRLSVPPCPPNGMIRSCTDLAEGDA
jgi:hypothetical protein